MIDFLPLSSISLSRISQPSLAMITFILLIGLWVAYAAPFAISVPTTVDTGLSIPVTLTRHSGDPATVFLVLRSQPAWNIVSTTEANSEAGVTHFTFTEVGNFMFEVYRSQDRSGSPLTGSNNFVVQAAAENTPEPEPTTTWTTTSSDIGTTTSPDTLPTTSTTSPDTPSSNPDTHIDPSTSSNADTTAGEGPSDTDWSTEASPTSWDSNGSANGSADTTWRTGPSTTPDAAPDPDSLDDGFSTVSTTTNSSTPGSTLTEMASMSAPVGPRLNVPLIIGIVVGVAVFFFLLAGLLIYIRRRRRGRTYQFFRDKMTRSGSTNLFGPTMADAQQGAFSPIHHRWSSVVSGYDDLFGKPRSHSNDGDYASTIPEGASAYLVSSGRRGRSSRTASIISSTSSFGPANSSGSHRTDRQIYLHERITALQQEMMSEGNWRLSRGLTNPSHPHIQAIRLKLLTLIDLIQSPWALEQTDVQPHGLYG